MIALYSLLVSSILMAQGTYLEFKMSSGDNVAGSMKTYTQDGNVRTEMQMALPGMPGGGLKRAVLILKGDPKTTYTLNDERKTYTVSTLSGQEPSITDHSDYEVTVLGHEKVNGYDAIHVKVRAKDAQVEEELWTTTGVLYYDRYKASVTKYTSAGIYKALAAKGADGFPVRIRAGEHGHTVQIDLVKAEMRSNPASLFSLDGYTKSEGGYSGNLPDGMRGTISNVQNMTPEQRQRWIDSLRRAHGH